MVRAGLGTGRMDNSSNCVPLCVRHSPIQSGSDTSKVTRVTLAYRRITPGSRCQHRAVSTTCFRLVFVPVPEINRRNMLLMTGIGTLAAAMGMPDARADGARTYSLSDRLPPTVRLRGSNIVCNANPLGRPWNTYGDTIWAAMWTAWDWENWIKPQIDDAAVVGNAVRLWGSTQTFLSGSITEDTYFAQWRQMLDYCAGKNLYILPAGSDIQDNFEHPLTSEKAVSHYAVWADMLSDYPGVIGLDLMNEAWSLPIKDHVDYDWLLTTLRGCADSAHSSGLPVTVSFPLFDASAWSWSPTGPNPAGGMFAKCPVDPFFELSDYLDIHLYAAGTPDDLASTYENSWAAGKPMVFGEFGIGADKPATERSDFYDMVEKLVSAHDDHAGAIAWSCYDVNTTSNVCGLYSAPGVLRDDIAEPFATFPMFR